MWPALLDLLAATLVVFILVSFLQKLLSVEELETLWIRQQQEQFQAMTREHLAEEIERGKVGIARHQNALVFTFSDRVLFASGDYRLKPAGRLLIEKCRTLFEAVGPEGYAWVQVEGHTDTLPLRRGVYPSNNWQLSAARAISVVEILTAEASIDPARLSANGYASHRPVAENRTDAGRALNRRIEMRIFFEGPRELGTASASGTHDTAPATTAATTSPTVGERS